MDGIGDKQNRILNIIAFYNNYDEVKTYIEDVNRISNGRVDIAVVNNSDEFSESQYLNRYRVELYNYGRNVGYLNSLLYVIRDLPDIESYKYIILSNSDIYYPDKCFFEKLLKRDYGKEVGCIAPSVYNSAQKCYSNPHYIDRISKKKLKALLFVLRFRILTQLYMYMSKIKSKSKSDNKKSSMTVYSPHGCYMILTNSFANYLKGKTYGTLLYSEESYIGEELIRSNMVCYYDSDIEVVHEESTVTGKLASTYKIGLWRDSIEYILRHYYN